MPGVPRGGGGPASGTRSLGARHDRPASPGCPSHPRAGARCSEPSVLEESGFPFRFPVFFFFFTSQINFIEVWVRVPRTIEDSGKIALSGIKKKKKPKPKHQSTRECHLINPRPFIDFIWLKKNLL